MLHPRKKTLASSDGGVTALEYDALSAWPIVQVSFLKSDQCIEENINDSDVFSLQDSQASVAEKAHKAVVNLTAEEEFRSKILSFQTDPDFLTFMLEYVLKPDSMLADIACSILSNLSQSEAGAYKIVQRMVANKELVGFARLIQVFCRENFNTHAKLHYLGPLLSNLTKIKEARLALLDKSQCVIQRLVPYTEYADSVVRRGGVIGALRNCCFETGKYREVCSHVGFCVARIVFATLVDLTAIVLTASRHLLSVVYL